LPIDSLYKYIFLATVYLKTYWRSCSLNLQTLSRPRLFSVHREYVVYLVDKVSSANGVPSGSNLNGYGE